ncbi:unconventional myosin-X-like isoform X2 [Ptychodera flava]|uniref:unconventional myosin-X-like isoform X2 n=1 Tax=Ptychodera flava TaxID=63121 RepID=UPI003969E7CC
MARRKTSKEDVLFYSDSSIDSNSLHDLLIHSASQHGLDVNTSPPTTTPGKSRSFKSLSSGDLSSSSSGHQRKDKPEKGSKKRNSRSKSRDRGDSTTLTTTEEKKKSKKGQKREKAKQQKLSKSRPKFNSHVLSDDEIDDATSSSEVVMLREQLKTLSTELVSLRTALVMKTANGLTNSNSQSDLQPLNQPDFSEDSIIQERRDDSNSSSENQNTKNRKFTQKFTASMIATTSPKDLEDLIHLCGPLTEDSIIKTLQHRWDSGCPYTKIGPILLSMNAYKGDPHAMDNALLQPADHNPYLLNIVKEAVRLQTETGYSQAMVLSGESGSGKTHSSMLLLRQLYDLAGGGPGTDGFKHVSAAVTVLRSLGSAATLQNSESTRMGYYTEIHVSEGVIFRSKIHCYFIDHSRITQTSPNEKGYHIFYEMLAGLTPDERVKLHLQGYSAHNLNCLNHLLAMDTDADSQKFKAWKNSLSVLGIPFSDVMRILAAVLLLSNIEFMESSDLELDIRGNNEIKAVAALLGVSGVSLYRGLTTKTRCVRGQIFKTLADAATANATRDSVAKALYCRTVSAIARKANSVRRPGSNSGHSSSSDDVHHSDQQSCKQPSPATSKLSVNHSSAASTLGGSLGDGVISIVDMFGFENNQSNQFEQLCINLCAETLQHYYNTHVFKSTQECCREEGIPFEIDIEYQDSTPVIELISAPLTGIFYHMDKESANLENKRSSASFAQNITAQHEHSLRFYNPEDKGTYGFGIKHYSGNVVYDATHMVDRNRDLMADDIMSIFQKQNCNFGFATHLFLNDLKGQGSSPPQGNLHRIYPTSSLHTDHSGKDGVKRTFSQDFQSRIDNLLKTLMHSKPHFIRCIRPNHHESATQFDLAVVRQQIRALQVLETVHLMAGGYPQKMRFKSFNHRYKFLSVHKRLRRSEEKAIEDTKGILDSFLKAMDESKLPYASTNWALGKRHIFLSEGARQCLEQLRHQRREEAATVIQANVRRMICLKQWPSLRRSLEQKNRVRTQNNVQSNRKSPMYQEIERHRKRGQESEACDIKTIQQTCYLYGLDMDNPPPLPSSRPYTVSGNSKMGFPQTRIMKHNFPEGHGDVVLKKGDTVQVIGVSPRRGHLMVDYNDNVLHVPYQLTELKLQTSPRSRYVTGVEI